MDKPIVNQDNSITIPECYGYWDMELYPWGGCFRRMPQETTLPINRIYHQYSDGTPSAVICKMAGHEVGIKL